MFIKKIGFTNGINDSFYTEERLYFDEKLVLPYGFTFAFVSLEV